jgi:hypothetical protein
MITVCSDSLRISKDWQNFLWKAMAQKGCFDDAVISKSCKTITGKKRCCQALKYINILIRYIVPLVVP